MFFLSFVCDTLDLFLNVASTVQHCIQKHLAVCARMRLISNPCFSLAFIVARSVFKSAPCHRTNCLVLFSIPSSNFRIIKFTSHPLNRLPQTFHMLAFIFNSPPDRTYHLHPIPKYNLSATSMHASMLYIPT